MVWIHGMCFLAPGTFTPGLAMVTAAGVLIFGLAIEMVYHRLICHKSFTSPKWFEYSMAYLGALNIQVWLRLANEHLQLLCVKQPATQVGLGLPSGTS